MGKAGSPRSAASSALMPRTRWEKPTASQGRPGRSQGDASSTTSGSRPHTPFFSSLLQAAKLKARLTLMEGWLQGSDCGQPWEPLHILQGEAPRGDVYQGHHLLQGTVREKSGRQRAGWLARHTPLALWSALTMLQKLLAWP